ncbi:hypothetical protein PPTG_06045 [Phytophthora nicotianae INRA-310]|uniref:CBM1 domain-containing protein n=3 Tax=Phytophthora nicotianae TaxID=4792 RepID=W2QV14_PHYN3|nr:hypothetical protein PPTG_06045 [Phytophthora nicotianae INRA-310]ETL26270.1 hypothetical protein L916_20047 [Phytophthora nicotianae]ETO61182.1 hypothetical protein F444_20774 [Phytophthora nicotianae P1976]KUF92251.1 hypothetical protein AM588_10003596 [Phytophthora nicotianae]ETN16963.1 hypothetical protein PPTG_06045 [Phytophthora nicotianae INRA-310]KUG01153.1 hypothetical protein AM587_10006201 [Phytophthora nicotianae]
MKIFVLAATAIAALSAVHGAEQSSLHLRIHAKGGACTITNESQCDGQNWTGSTCCADSNYECRWSDDGQNVKRCQKKRGKGQHHKDVEDDSDDDSDIDGDDVASALGIDPDDYDNFSDYDDYSDWFGDDDSSDSEDDSSESKDEDTKHHRKGHTKGGSCTITNESQCDGQNWTGSTCCANPNYECRWSDDGQNVKRCQKKRG